MVERALSCGVFLNFHSLPPYLSTSPLPLSFPLSLLSVPLPPSPSSLSLPPSLPPSSPSLPPPLSLLLSPSISSSPFPSHLLSLPPLLSVFSPLVKNSSLRIPQANFWRNPILKKCITVHIKEVLRGSHQHSWPGFN